MSDGANVHYKKDKNILVTTFLPQKYAHLFRL